MSDLIAVPKHKVDRLAEKLTTAQAEIEALRARCGELEDALVWALGKLSIEVPVSGGNVTYTRAFEKADSALGKSSSEPWLLRKQAEAVDKEIDMGEPPKHPKMTMMDVIQRACGELPAGINLDLSLEEGAATIEAYDRYGQEIDLPENVDEPLEQQLNFAVSYLIAWNRTEMQGKQAQEIPTGSIVEDVKKSIAELADAKHAQVEELALHLLPSAYRENMAIARAREQAAAQDVDDVDYERFLQCAVDDSFDLADRFIARSEGLREERLHDAEAKVKGVTSIRNRE